MAVQGERHRLVHGVPEVHAVVHGENRIDREHVEEVVLERARIVVRDSLVAEMDRLAGRGALQPGQTVRPFDDMGLQLLHRPPPPAGRHRLPEVERLGEKLAPGAEDLSAVVRRVRGDQLLLRARERHVAEPSLLLLVKLGTRLLPRRQLHRDVQAAPPAPEGKQVVGRLHEEDDGELEPLGPMDGEHLDHVRLLAQIRHGGVLAVIHDHAQVPEEERHAIHDGDRSEHLHEPEELHDVAGLDLVLEMGRGAKTLDDSASLEIRAEHLSGPVVARQAPERFEVREHRLDPGTPLLRDLDRRAAARDPLEQGTQPPRLDRERVHETVQIFARYVVGVLGQEVEVLLPGTLGKRIEKRDQLADLGTLEEAPVPGEVIGNPLLVQGAKERLGIPVRAHEDHEVAAPPLP